MHRAFARNWQITKHAVRSKRGIVVAQNQKAAAVGADVLAAGGNAMDAAIAASFALGTCEPWMSGMGGGGCMLGWLAAESRPFALEFNMRSPAATDPADYPLTGAQASDLFPWPEVEGNRNLQGPLSWGVPGYLAGIGLAHERFATMPWAELLAPAIGMAREGLEIDWYASLLIASSAAALSQDATTRSIWLPGGLPPAVDMAGGTYNIQLGRLADTLAHVAEAGHRTAYEGDLAASIARDSADLGGRLALGDLAAYEAREVDPLTFTHRGATIHAMPGLFAGVSLKQTLGQLAGMPFDGDWPDARTFVAYADALKATYADRLANLGAGDSDTAPSCTTHLTVVDKEGNMVALTQTLLSIFGSRVVLPDSGILMNNGMMWFDPVPGRPNSIGASKQPLSNMCPVVATDSRHRIAMGASGGRKIMPSVMQLLSFIFDFDMSLEEAFAQPRIDVSGVDRVTAPASLPKDVVAGLKAAGHEVRTVRRAPFPLNFACPGAVMNDLEDNHFYGTAEISHPWADATEEPAPEG